MKNDLTGKVALVTGAGRGIGKAIAIAFAAAGADVAVNYVAHGDRAEEVCAQISRLGRRSVPVRADVSDSRQVQQMVETVEKELGPISLLVNNAGVSRPQAIEEITEKDWDEIISVNLKSVFLVTQAVLPGMRSRHWGRIINLSSVAAQTGGIVGLHYTAAKAGVLGLTRAYASRLVREGITVNAIAPAIIRTDMIAGLPGAVESHIPMGRIGTPGEVADVALMLARNGYITGQTINVNGGLYMS